MKKLLLTFITITFSLMGQVPITASCQCLEIKDIHHYLKERIKEAKCKVIYSDDDCELWYYLGRFESLLQVEKDLEHGLMNSDFRFDVLRADIDQE